MRQTAGLPRDGSRTAAVVWRVRADRLLHAATPDTGEGTRKQRAWSAADTTPGVEGRWPGGSGAAGHSMEGDRERPKYLMPEVPGQILSRQMIGRDARTPRGEIVGSIPRVGSLRTKVLSARCVGPLSLGADDRVMASGHGLHLLSMVAASFYITLQRAADPAMGHANV